MAEGDECESDERFGVVEPERDLGERVDPGVGTGFGARRPHRTPELSWHRGFADFTDRLLGRTFDAGGRQPAGALADSVALHPVLQHLLSSLWTARNLEADRVQPHQRPPTHPQIQQESAICAVRLLLCKGSRALEGCAGILGVPFPGCGVIAGTAGDGPG